MLNPYRWHHVPADLGHHAGEWPHLAERQPVPAQLRQGSRLLHLHVRHVMEAVARHHHGLPVHRLTLQALRRVLQGECSNPYDWPSLHVWLFKNVCKCFHQCCLVETNQRGADVTGSGQQSGGGDDLSHADGAQLRQRGSRGRVLLQQAVGGVCTQQEASCSLRLLYVVQLCAYQVSLRNKRLFLFKCCFFTDKPNRTNYTMSSIMSKGSKHFWIRIVVVYFHVWIGRRGARTNLNGDLEGIDDVKHIVLVLDLGAGVAGGNPVLRRTLGGDEPDEWGNSHFFHYLWAWAWGMPRGETWHRFSHVVCLH